MSEVRKAQTYGRDPRNGHSTIYCISKAGTRACSSRPCVVVSAEPAVHRRGRGSDHAAPGRPPRPTSPLRRRSPRRSRLRDVLRRASGAQFLIARRGRGSGRRSTASTTARSRVPRRAARRPSTASRRTSPRRPRAVLLRCSAFFHQVGINVRRLWARRSITSTSSRAYSDALASVARLLYALVALGLAYIRCVENADDPRPVLELPVGPQNAPFCSFRCRASERSMCGGWGGCEESSVRRSANSVRRPALGDGVVGSVLSISCVELLLTAAADDHA